MYVEAVIAETMCIFIICDSRDYSDYFAPWSTVTTWTYGLKISEGKRCKVHSGWLCASQPYAGMLSKKSGLFLSMHQKCCESWTCVMGRHLEDLNCACTGDIKNYSTSPAPWDIGTNCIFIIFFIWRYAVSSELCVSMSTRSQTKHLIAEEWAELVTSAFVLCSSYQELTLLCPSVASRRTGCASPGVTADDLDGWPAAYEKFLMKS